MADRVALVHATDADARALLTTDDELHGWLRRLTSLLADVLGADGAGASLAYPGDTLTPVAVAGGSMAGVHERLAAVSGGPCAEALRRGMPVAVADMAQDGRWPLYRSAALEAGIAAMMCMPLMARADGFLGALAVYRTACHDWHDAELTTAREIAAVASVHIAKQDELDRASTLAAQLQRALDRRVVIEQAKGVLIERHHLSPDEAFEQLRSAARDSRRRVHDIAAELVEDVGTRAADRPWLRGPTDGRVSMQTR